MERIDGLASPMERVVVLVVAADPELKPIALVAAFRRTVEDPVVAHQELDSAVRSRVGVVDGAVGAYARVGPQPSLR